MKRRFFLKSLSSIPLIALPEPCPQSKEEHEPKRCSCPTSKNGGSLIGGSYTRGFSDSLCIAPVSTISICNQCGGTRYSRGY